MLAAQKRQETHFPSNEDKEQWMKHYVVRETPIARKRVEDSEAAVQQEQEDMKHAEIVVLRNQDPKNNFEVMMVAIGACLSDLAGSDAGEDGDDHDDQEAEQGKLSEDDEPGWVIGTITKTVQQRIERCWQKQMKLDELTQPGWEDAAHHFSEWEEKYSTSELVVPAIVQPRTDDDTLAAALTTFGVCMQCLAIVPGISPMPQGASGPANCQMRVGSMELLMNMRLSCLEPAAERDMSHLLKAKPDEPVCYYPCI